MRNPTKRPRGSAMLELVVVTGILAIATVAIAQMLLSSRNAIEVATVQAGLEAKAQDTVERIANELKEAGYSSLAPRAPISNAYPCTSLDFALCSGWGRYAGESTYPMHLTFYPPQPYTPGSPSTYYPALANGVAAPPQPSPVYKLNYSTQSTTRTVNGVAITITYLNRTDGSTGTVETISDQLAANGLIFQAVSPNMVSISITLQQKYFRSGASAGVDSAGALTYTACATTTVVIHNP